MSEQFLTINFSKYDFNFTDMGSMGSVVLQDFTLRGCVIGLMVIVGIPLNILTIIGFAGVKNKSSHTFLLQCLAAADVFLLLMTFLEYSMWHFFEFFETFTLCEYSKVYYKWNFLIGGFHTISVDLAVWAVVLVTLDRWICIFLPTRAQRFCQIRVAAMAIFLVLVFVCAFNGHYFVINKYKMTVANITNETLYGAGQCGVEFSAGGSQHFKTVYYFVDSAINLITPMVSVVVLDAGMILALRRSRLRMGKRKDEASSSATIVLVLLATSFVIFEIPEVVHIVFRALGPEYYSFNLTYVALFFQVFNSFSNFFIYILIGRTFRNALRTSITEMCCCCFPKRLRVANSGTYSRTDYNKAAVTEMTTAFDGLSDGQSTPPTANAVND